MKFRSLIGGLGLLGMLGLPNRVEGQDTTQENELPSLEESYVWLREHISIILDYRDYQRQILDSNGATFLFITSSCPDGKKSNGEVFLEEEATVRNMNYLIHQLVDKFSATSVKGFPIKWTLYDYCVNGREMGAPLMKPLGEHGMATIMYLDGREIDRMRGGPIEENGVAPQTRNMSYWIEYTLLNKRLPEDQDRDVILLYKGDYSWEEFPRSVLNQ